MKRGLRKVSLRKISEKILWLMTLIFSVAGQEEAKGPGNVIARPGEDVELLCTVTPSSGNAYFAWMVNYMGPYGVNSLHNGVLPGYSATLDKSNIIVKNIVMNDGRNGSKFKCVTVLNGKVQDESDTTYLYVAGVPKMVPDLNTNIDINGSNVTLTLSWGEPFNNLDPIVNYTVSCSGDITCPPNFTTTDNTTRSYTITNLTTMTNYAFSVVATNSIGSGEAGIVMITTPPGNTSVSITTSSKSVTVTTQGVNVTTYSSSEDMLITTSSVSMTANTLSVGMTTTTSSQGMATTTSSVGITTTTSSEGMTTTSSEGMTTTSSVGMTSVDITTTSREGVTTTTSNEGMTTTTSSESMTTTTSNEGMTTTTSSEGMTTTTSNKGMTTTSSVDVTTTSSVGMTTTTSVGSVTSPMATSATVAPTVTPTVITSMAPSVVPNVTVDSNTININGNDVTLTLSWGEPFNNFDPIVYYTVSCSGDVTCPQNFTTTDNTTRSYTITNLTTMTNYTFSVVATNSIGSGEAGVVMITTPGIPKMVPDVTATVIISTYEKPITLTLSWKEPFNNFDPIVNYSVSCSGDGTCPPNFTTTDNTTRNYTFIDLITMANYTFSVVATNSIGSGEAGIVMITTPGPITQGPNNVTYLPDKPDIVLTCTVSVAVPIWIVNGTAVTLSQLNNTVLPGHTINGTNIVIEAPPPNNTVYICEVSPSFNQIFRSDPAFVYVAGAPDMVGNIVIDFNTVNVSNEGVRIILNWNEPFDNFDPIETYTVTISCNGEGCPAVISSITKTSFNVRFKTDLSMMTPISVTASNNVGTSDPGTILMGAVPDGVGMVNITCGPVDVINQCIVTWNALAADPSVVAAPIHYNVSYYGESITDSSVDVHVPMAIIDLPAVDSDVNVIVTAMNVFGSGPGSKIAMDKIKKSAFIITGRYQISANNVQVFFNSTLPATFQCKLDKDSAVKCVSGYIFTAVSVGKHRIQLIARLVSDRKIKEVLKLKPFTIQEPTTTSPPPPLPPKFTASANVFNECSVKLNLSSDVAATFRCRVNGGQWKTCSDGYVVSDLPPAIIEIEIEASAVQDPHLKTVATTTINLMGQACSVLEINHPVCSPLVVGNNFTFTFNANKANVEYLCSLNNKQQTSCNEGSVTYSNLQKSSDQLLTITAFTCNGETLNKSFTFSSKFNSKFCKVYICGDGVVTSNSSALATFLCDDPDATFNCKLTGKLNGKRIRPCTSPLQLSDLSPGTYTLEIKPECARKASGRKFSTIFSV